MLRSFSKTPIKIPFEQAVYGSFPFWHRGYDLLAASPGCQAAWLDALREASQNYGERPRGAVDAAGLFAVCLNDGVWMIVGPSAQGEDDQGRPGAVAFHALFVTQADYRKARANPFQFAGAHQSHWSPETQTLPSGIWTLPGPPASGEPPSERAVKIVEALRQGHRVALETAGPINALAEEVWNALPLKQRQRTSVATWAFRNGSRFDLVALPRLTGVDLDATYLDPFAPASERSAENVETATSPTGQDSKTSPLHKTRQPFSRRVQSARRWLPFMLLIFIFLTIAIFLISSFNNQKQAPLPDDPTIDQALPAPSRDRYQGTESRIDSEVRQRVTSGLVDLAERFQVVEVNRYSQADNPTTLMILLANRLRYPGPWLTPSEHQALAQEPEGDRALAWDSHLRHFANDRPLPNDFRAGPLRWQLDTLAWSFHLEPDPRLSVAEVPHVLAHELALDRTIRPHPLADRFPTLHAYEGFLKHLPRR